MQAQQIDAGFWLERAGTWMNRFRLPFVFEVNPASIRRRGRADGRNQFVSRPRLLRSCRNPKLCDQCQAAVAEVFVALSVGAAAASDKRRSGLI